MVTLVDVLREAKDEDWFRPVSWKNYGEAFTVIRNMTYVVPTKKGGELFMTCLKSDLLGEWEIVTPDQVYEEVQNVSK